MSNYPFKVLLKKSKIMDYKVLPIMTLMNAGKPITEKDIINIINKNAQDTNTRFTYEGIQDYLMEVQSGKNYLKNQGLDGRHWLDQSEINDLLYKELIIKQLKAYQMEQKAISLIKDVFPGIKVLQTEELDINFAVDFVLCDYNTEEYYYGIQVKPISFSHSNEIDKTKILNKHRLFERNHLNTKVSFMYYGEHHFQDSPQVIEKIWQHLNNATSYVNYFNSNEQYS
ncbi:hypothetical protein [Hymenobacter volaticus]|uniref:Restriction endonuclease n=1 Tax=Hymenobacter volaticus TaxID=2932254 RepID=A0ABY4G252_9BACT|nr:hypothetical protein [Hymenobacter volaticus]UOQ64882.1 hypothetical protein MUN86_15065 [Hymenobacter volaticus]